MFSVNTFVSGSEFIVAACDEELLGKEFKEGKKRLLVDETFYGGSTVDEQELIELLGKSTIANLTGEKTIKAAIDAKIILSDHVLKIDGIPHAQYAKYMR